MIEKILSMLKDRNVFLTGGGGVGKSYTSEKIISHLRALGLDVVVLGSTGISAVNISGQTLHSFFKFGICSNTEELIQYDKRQKQKLKELHEMIEHIDLLVIDEISMVSADLMEMIRYRLMRGSYNGKILFVGDFFQLPPVIKNKQSNLFNNLTYAFQSSAWEYFDPYLFELEEAQRSKNEVFTSILNNIRRGILNKDIIEYLKKLCEQKNVWDMNPTILFGKNHYVDQMNQIKLGELKEPLIKIASNQKNLYENLHESKIQSWIKSLPVPTELELKVGAHVLFCTNKWGKYANGERGIIKEIEPDRIVVQKDSGVVIVERHTFCLSENTILDGEIEEVVLASVEQFPIRLAYAISIHKSQGMSIEKLICNIDHIFEKSQFYVALSRATDPNGLCIDYNGRDFESHIRKIINVSQHVEDFYNKYK